MTYAKLIDGAISYAPRSVLVDGYWIGNPTPETLIDIGYKPVNFTDPPETEPGYVAVPGWYDDGDAIRQVWTVVEEPDEVDADRAMEILFGGEEE